jgi:precorrin-3B synthase
MPAVPPRESSDDRCPGALRLHAADDGHVARVRVPGGRLTAAGLVALCDLADELGDGHLHLTSRGNVQVRGLSESAGTQVSTRLAAAGLLPSLAHDRVRNVVASPLSGIDGPSVEAVVRDLDEALVDDDGIVALSGRFLFGVDDGRGDVLALQPDVAVVVEDGGGETDPDEPGTVRLAVAGAPTAVTAPLDLAADLLVGAAHRFLALRDEHAPTAWRASELPDEALAELAPGRPGPRLSAAVTQGSLLLPSAAARARSGEHPVAAGVGLGVRDRAVHAGVPLGSGPTADWRTVATLADDIRLTPWRSVVLADPTDPAEAAAALERLGLLLDDEHAMAQVTACIGAPGCAKALADVRADAARLAVEENVDHPGRRLHVVGCERRCGHPAGPHLEAVAQPGGGYLTQER